VIDPEASDSLRVMLVTISCTKIHCAGFQPGGDPAFCGILGTVTVNSTTKHIAYPIIVGYEMWNYLAFLVLPVLYVSVRWRIRSVTRNDSPSQVSQFSLLVLENSVQRSHGLCTLTIMTHSLTGQTFTEKECLVTTDRFSVAWRNSKM